MARIEKTVFISYRRADVYTALAVYQDLSSKGYDVFFDYTSIPNGDFEQIIVSNIKARAHFVLILTPTALDRCNEPGDWLRREIEIAIDENRNIVPLFIKDFKFGSPDVAEKLTGKLGQLNRFNGLNVHEDYFQAAMDRLSRQFLNVPLDTPLQPYSTDVRERVKEQQTAADNALQQKWQEIKEILTPGRRREKDVQSASLFLRPTLRIYALGTGILAAIVAGIIGINALLSRNSNRITLTITSPVMTSLGIPMAASTETSIHPVGTATAEILTSILTREPTLTDSPPTSTVVIPSIGPTSQYELGSIKTSSEDGMVMVYIPAGSFPMGSDTGNDNEKPVHTVYLDAFWIDRTEITNQMYQNCVRADVCRLMAYGSYDLDVAYSDFPASADWDDAIKYCTWVNRRLPTEAEWEKAASWDEVHQIKNVFPWGDKVDCSYANFKGQYTAPNVSCIGKRTKVGSYPKGASPYGVYDMAGNVWEWVSSLLEPYPYNATDGREDLSVDGVRVIRGGTYSSLDGARTTSRSGCQNCGAGTAGGFRCAMSATE